MHRDAVEFITEFDVIQHNQIFIVHGSNQIRSHRSVNNHRVQLATRQLHYRIQGLVVPHNLIRCSILLGSEVTGSALLYADGLVLEGFAVSHGAILKHDASLLGVVVGIAEINAHLPLVVNGHTGNGNGCFTGSYRRHNGVKRHGLHFEIPAEILGNFPGDVNVQANDLFTLHIFKGRELRVRCNDQRLRQSGDRT